MRTLLKYIVVGAVVAMAVAPSFVLAVTQPTIPPGFGGQALTGSSIVSIVNQVVNIFLTVSIVIAIGMFIYGAIKYALGMKEAGQTMTNAAIGIAAILAVGLIVNTIAGLINRGGNLG